MHARINTAPLEAGEARKLEKAEEAELLQHHFGGLVLICPRCAKNKHTRPTKARTRDQQIIRKAYGGAYS